MSVPAHGGSDEITPPSSFHGPPLTPPPTDEKTACDKSYILRQIAEHKSSYRGQAIYKVDKTVWTAVSSDLLHDDKLRYARSVHQVNGVVTLMSKHRFDYFPSIERLVLRVPEIEHEHFSRSLSSRITEHLRTFSHGSGSAAEFAKDILDVGSVTITSRDPEYGTHCPDGAFQHSKSPDPNVVIEVAYSQNRKDLRTLADEYILGSDLKIGVLIGVDLDYRRSKRATFSIWRARLRGPDDDKAWVAEAVVANQIFRHDDGTPNIDQNAGLHLCLEDFADQETCRQFNDIDRDIFVSCEELYQFLERGEAVAKITKSKKPEPSPPLKKRRRAPTPEEQLEDSDEKAYVEDEERV
ncbi:uncharacterized protein Z520_12184 [Fonsecaea multimorphosa CBS 102226]|uniref:Restriction endonuclease domain-containing protein n=1 Tax=Fonsecaea multimorphosa CBS 102226 TaxID=1442371 RepID=A0A0D2GRE0_9EURO|nr:uncharacterized protein Z520_12184 [Fonsecaea multimorphosa CBS 102226]KIX92100.1 hypothetical protein Z520_12184 [Fonsecaea multimorphosa CBS 102226]OAL17464.1 hypothetical protein AYO22_11596 [Fonsecaea multimorphosa]